ncbi:hypothetical protein H5A21_06015 [Pectobacterium aquaticum]|nr:hypothetical protein [Pectobacterium aquaticum]MBN3063649.1 hypothetical protein [Pectobacterium aquaticum]
MKELIFITLLLAPIGNAIAGNIDLVKNQVIESIDATRTLGSALKHSRHCDSFKWDEGTDSDGRNVVMHTCQLKSEEQNQIFKSGLTFQINQINEDLRLTNGRAMSQTEADKGNARIENANRLRLITLTDATQTITWAIVPSVNVPVIILSENYSFKFSNGESYKFSTNGGGRNTGLEYLYGTTKSLTSVFGLASYIISQPPTKAAVTPQPTQAKAPSGDNDLTCQLEDKTQMTLSHNDTTVYIAFTSPTDDSDDGGQVIKLDIASGGAQQQLSTDSNTSGKYFVLRGTDGTSEGDVGMSYSLIDGKESASYSAFASTGKSSENLSCLPDTIKVTPSLLKSGLSHVGYIK